MAGQGKWDSAEAGCNQRPKCLTTWMAGAGIEPRFSYGTTDDFSYNVVETPVQVRDGHATALHVLRIDHKIDHKRFAHRYQGLDFRLTDVEPSSLVKDISG